MNWRVLLVGALAGVVSVAVGCGGKTREDASRSGTGGSGGGSSGAGAAAANVASDESSQVPLEARRYDPTRQCYWESALIDGLYAVEQHDPPNMGWGSVCVISDTGDVYVALLGTSQAVVKTDSTAAWKVPTWTGEWLTYYDYSAFTTEEEALCRTAMDGIAPAGADSGPATTCTDEAGDAGGSEPGQACLEDGDCATGFCDLGRCAEPDVQARRYGAECDESQTDPRIQLCAAYRCRDGRCRSCESSADCGADARCYIVPDRPGQSCGAASGDPSWTPVDDAGD
jgi:hypothetical protein